MKKIISLFLAYFILFASQLVAGDLYLGASSSISSTKVDTVSASATTRSSALKSGYGVKGGYEIEESKRIELEYISITSNIDGARINYVYRRLLANVKPFVGGGVGFIKYKEGFNVDGNKYPFNKITTSLNIKGGIIYELAKHHEIEFGYDYIGLVNKSQHFATPNQSLAIKLKNIRIGRLYVEYNYLF